MGTDAAIAELRARLRVYDEQRFPIQHATAQFHLGVALLDAGSPDAAAGALRTSVRLFEPLPVERAKARNLLGAALRARGDHEAAAEAFTTAAGAFEAADLPREHAAALFNLGLVQQERGLPEAAVPCLREAEQRFAELRLPAQAAGAARELAAAQLAAGRLEDARTAARRAAALADRAGDTVGLGAASTVLGLASLGLGEPGRAVEAFRSAAGANPRGLRPEGYALAKANLALAHEQAGDAPRAVLAARQALGVRPPPPDPVAGQATATLSRLAASAGAVVDVLDDEPADGWLAVLREEVLRWLDAGEADRRAALDAWFTGVLARGEAAPDLVHSWLAVLLELPPDAMDTLVRDALEVLAGRGDTERGRLQDHMNRALIRFHEPQWLRLRDTFNAAATRRGQEPAWR